MTLEDRPEPRAFESSDIFEALERVSSAISEAKTAESMLAGVLDVTLDVFDCDRAWLLYPCMLDAEYFQVKMERTRPEFPGAGATQEHIPIQDWVLHAYKLVLGSNRAVQFDAEINTPPALEEIHERFHIKSQMTMAMRPRGDHAWCFGMHHCRTPQLYAGSVAMFEAIGHRVEDGLTTFLAMQELRNSEQHLRTIIDHAPDAILIFDCDRGSFVDANPIAERLFGASREEILDDKGPEQFSPEFQPDGRRSEVAAKEYMAACLAGEFPHFEWTHLDTRGHSIPCEIHLAKLPHPTRRLIRGSLTDISQRKEEERERVKLEAKLAQSQKMEAIGNLTGGVAHDFNNLLTVILGNLDLLDLDPGNPQFVVDQVAQVRAAAERAGSLTHRLLAFARQQPLRPRPVKVAELLHGMHELLQRTIGPQIEIAVAADNSVWTCELDAIQLENAILNLAVNSRDAMPGGGLMKLNVSNTHLDMEDAEQHDEVKPGQYVLLSVSDTGSGVSPEVLDEIFDPFFTTKGVGKGTGLGLSMVYGFVRQSGGHVLAESTLGEGTTVKIYLPRSLQGPTETMP